MYTNPTTEEQSTVRDLQKKINALHLNYIYAARKENVAIKNNNVLVVDDVVDMFLFLVLAVGKKGTLFER